MAESHQSPDRVEEGYINESNIDPEAEQDDQEEVIQIYNPNILLNYYFRHYWQKERR